MSKKKKYSKGGKLPKYQNGGDPPIKIDVVDNLPTINIPIGSPLNPLTKSSTDYAHRENDRYMFGQQPDAYQSPYKEYQQQLFRQYQSDPGFMYDINKQGFDTYADLGNLNKGSLKGQYVPDEQGFTFEPQYSLPDFTVVGKIPKPDFKDETGGNWKNWDKLTPEEQMQIKKGKFKNKYEKHLVENKATYNPGEWSDRAGDALLGFVTTPFKGVANTFNIPMALMTEGLEAASGHKYNYGNAFDIFGDSQRTLSDVMDIDPTAEMLVDPGNVILSGILSKAFKAGKFLKPGLSSIDDVASAGLKSQIKLPKKIKDVNSLIDETIGSVTGKIGGKNKKALKEANEFLDYWTTHPATEDKIISHYNKQIDAANLIEENYDKAMKEYQKDMEWFRTLTPEEQFEVGAPMRPILSPTASHYKNQGPLDMLESLERASPEVEYFPLSRQYKDIFTNKGNIHTNNLGVYYSESWKEALPERAGKAWLSRDPSSFTKKASSTGIHEGTHKWTDANRLLSDIEKLSIKNVLDPEYQKYAKNYWENPYGSKEYWKGYYADPTEVHARVMELRNFYGIKPDDVINKTQAEKILKDVMLGKTKRKGLNGPTSLDDPTRKVPVDKQFAKAMMKNSDKKWDDTTYERFAKMMNTLRTTAPIAGGAGAASYLLNDNTDMKAYGGYIGGPGDDKKKKKAKDVGEQNTFSVEGMPASPYTGKSYHAYPSAAPGDMFKRTMGDMMYDMFHKDPRVRTTFANGGPINPPIKTSDPADPRLHNYMDSLNLYNAYQQQLKFNPEGSLGFSAPRNTENLESFYQGSIGKAPDTYYYKDIDDYKKISKERDALYNKYKKEDGYADWDKMETDPEFERLYPPMDAAMDMETYTNPDFGTSKEDLRLLDYYNSLSFYNPTVTGLWDTPDLGSKTIMPTERWLGGAWNPAYKKPVQPYEYTGDPKDLEQYRDKILYSGEDREWKGGGGQPKKKSSRLKDLMADAGDTDYSFAHRKEIAKSLGIENYTGSLEQNIIMKDHFKNLAKEKAVEVENVSTNVLPSKDIEHKVDVAPVNAVPKVSTPQPVTPVGNMKPKDKLVPRDVVVGYDANGNPVYGEQYSRVRSYAFGGPTDPGKQGMMKARLAYEEMHGNPAAKRMVAGTDNPYNFGDGTIGTHYMASFDNYAVPQIQEQNGNLILGDFGPRSNETMRFDSPEDANYFAENYKTVAPAFRAMGGFTKPQYEAEKGEVVDGGMPVAFNGGSITPNSMTSGKINGQTHEQGGVDMAGGKRVFSDRLKVDSDFLKDLDI